MAIGIALGSGIGIPIGIAVGNPGLFGIGLPIGLAIGAAIGSSIQAKYQKEGRIRPLTSKEKETEKKLVVMGIALVVIGIITFLFFLLKF
jgi:hypothetical protein